MKQQGKRFQVRQARWVITLALLLTVVFGAGSVLAADSSTSTAKISPRLAALSMNLTRSADNQISLQSLGLSESGPMSLIKSDTGQVLVYIRVSDTGDEQISALTSKGASVTHIDDRYSMVTAYISTSGVESIAALPFVKHISEVLRPMVHQADCSSATTSEGDGQLNADTARTTYSVDGTGVTVGVLSDSYAKVTTPISAANDISTGDLPGTGNPCGRTTPVNVIDEYTGTDGSDEGRAMAQIVHDLAPGASLAFATAFGGLYDFADNIVALRNNANADIIVDDVSYFDEPMFQDGPVSVAISQVVDSGAQYFTSAGNSNATDGASNNISSYEAAAYRPTTCPTLTEGGNPVTTINDCHDFDPSASTATYQEMEIASGGSLIFIFQWNEPWYGVVTDLDLYITDTSNVVLASSKEVNAGGAGSQKPAEGFTLNNTTASAITIRIFITRKTGTATPRCKYVLFRSSGVNSTSINETNNTVDTFGPTISGHSGEDTALSIAAVPYDDATSPESFTSQGYFTAYWGPVNGTTAASPLTPPDTRLKPDVAATDGGANTFFGQLVSSDWRFYGTSAAAPHAAAVAALISEMYYNTYSLMPNQAVMETSLEATATNVANGSQESTGAGLVNAVAAVAEALTHEIRRSTSTDSGGGCFVSTFGK